MHPYSLPITVFLAGFCIMILEIIGARIVAPYIGTSFFVWTSLIGIILASISLGNYLGGKIADRHAETKKLSQILLAAAILIALTSLLKEFILTLGTLLIPNIKIASIIISLILFSTPTILLGMITPYSIKLSLKNLQNAGEKIGNFSAIATAGSIIGTFTAGFILLPLIGSTKILFFLAIILLLNSLILLKKKPEFRHIAAIALIILSFFEIKLPQAAGTLIAEADSHYNRIRVFDNDTIFPGKKIRILKVGNELDSAKFADSDELVFNYTKYFRISDHFLPEPKSALLIGGGALSIAEDFLKRHPQATLDVIEIDPKVTEFAEKYFQADLKNPRLQIFHEDGRTFLNRTKKKYDLIYLDAFHSFYSIPFQLTTRESFEKIRQALNDNGLMLANIISAFEGEKGKFLRAEYRTVNNIFSETLTFQAHAKTDANEPQNIILIGFKSGTNNMKNAFLENNPELKKHLGTYWKKEIVKDMPELTDDFAPVDQYVLEML